MLHRKFNLETSHCENTVPLLIWGEFGKQIKSNVFQYFVLQINFMPIIALLLADKYSETKRKQQDGLILPQYKQNFKILYI